MTFISNYLRYVKTNLPMTAMMDLAGNINNFSSDKMTTHTVPGMEETIGGVSYYIPDYQKTWDIVDENFTNFKLQNWTKGDSGYMEYDSYGEIKDESKDRGIEDPKEETKEQEDQLILPQTQTIDGDKDEENKDNPTPAPARDMLDESLDDNNGE